MKLTIAPDVLAAAVAWAARTLPARPSVPVLAGLLLEAGADGTLTISAFDYDTSTRATIETDTVSEPGKILLPGRLLAEICKALPDRSMAELAATDSECTLTCGTVDYNLRLLPVDDYPNLPAAPAHAGTVDGSQFADAGYQVHVACSNDDTLPMLTGIRFDADGDTLTLAATDRYRIAVRDLTWEPAGEQTLGVLVPGRVLHDITKNADGQLTLAFNDGLAAITTPGRQTTIRLLDSQFIDYRAKVKIDAEATATLDPQALAAAVKRVALVADRKNAGIRLAFTNGQVRVQAGDADTGRGGDTVPCELAGDPLDIAFQSNFLLDALGPLGTEQASIRMATGDRPALFVSGNYQQLAMSLRLP